MSDKSDKVETKKGKRFTVRFGSNRSYELYIGRKMIPFKPYGVKKLTEEEVNHPDFVRVKSMFSVVEE